MRPTSFARRLAAALLVLLALPAACDSSTAPDDGAAAVHDILVVARVRGFDELFAVPLAGGAPEPLFPAELNAHHPSPSPDGRRVALLDLADDEVWIAERGAARVRNVSQFGDELDAMPAWSPDGARIAFASYRSGGSDIYVADAAGGQPRNLMPSEFPAVHFDDAPAWSPDGSRIAFSSDRGGRRAIWTMRPDGSDMVQVTTSPAARDFEPSWSPDGRRIVFRRVRDDAGVTRTDLAIVTLATGAVVDLPQPGNERHPSWSPDGAWIAYTTDAVGNDTRVFTIRPDGTDPTERAGGAAVGRYAAYPRWIRRR